MDPGPTGGTKFADINEYMGPMAMDDILAPLRFCKIRKPPGSDRLNFELIKYARQLYCMIVY